MVVQKSQINNGMTTHTFVTIGMKTYCHSNNGVETLVFPARMKNDGYEIADFSEILDNNLVSKINKIVEG
tara:strand:- start:12 stop:221 length:210 start_codon:yes stop_codon:yes gene_type:complete